ncbi:MAG TPA: DUF4231 domain-containing protein [Bryobacteraceae bacterium]|jgi:hypothetical protein|nr:DUF4231 domain-containing protein [Bryobacteraceae bacterium]
MSALEASDPTIDRLENQIEWYDVKSRSNQRWYKRLKVVTLVSAALVPVASFVPQGKFITAGLGVVIAVMEGLQQLNQFQANWAAYRSTCEALKHEKYLYVANAGPYATTERPLALLAERIEGLVSQEHAKWVSAQEQAASKKPERAP